MSTNENGEEVIVEDVDESMDIDTTSESAVDWEAKAKEYEGRLKRAETKLKKSSEKPAESKPSTSNGLDLAKTEEATIAGKRSGSTTQDSVDYWMNKPIEDVPKDMVIKVVNAKLAKEKTTGVFYNS